MNINGWYFADINAPKGDEVQTMVNDTDTWIEVAINPEDVVAMNWPSENCAGLYYKYFRDGGNYIKFSDPRDAVMFKLQF